MKNTQRFLAVLIWAFFPLLLPACYVTAGGGPAVSQPYYDGGPPPHAPAHGYRRHKEYQYYPAAQIYFSPERNTYYYLDGSSWRASTTLPRHLQLRLDTPVVIEIDSDEPYRDFDKHRSKYPPEKNRKRR